MTTLRGLTWAHSRGYVPLVAASEAWRDFHPDVEIVWEKRSFWGFGEGPLDEVARMYDLVIFDHPFTGRVASRRLFLPLDEHLPPTFLDQVRSESVGPSYASYSSGGQQWGLPVDTASQIAVCRPDLLSGIPRTWEDMIELARDTGRVRAAFSPMGAVGMFHTLCAAQGFALYQPDALVDLDHGIQVLEQLQHLLDAVGAAALDAGPVRILGELAATNDALYAPLVYGYVNYTRPGYARFPLRFAPIPVGDGISGAVLGGAGLGISAWSHHREVALRFAEWVCGPECQSTLYVQHGGQPGLRGAWHGPFFEEARPLVERAWVRPTWDGYTDLQSAAGRALHVFFRRQASASATVHHLNQLYLRRDLNSYASR